MKYDNLSIFGLNFEKVNKDNFRQILIWRNNDFVRNNMLFKDIITIEMHEKWFYNLDQKRNFYYIVSLDQKPFGVFSISNINYDDKLGETGSYLVSQEFQNTGLAIKAGYGLAEIAFNYLLLENLYCRVLKDNNNALKLNLNQGFKIKSEQNQYFRLELSKSDYYNNKTNRRILTYLNNN